ncbi:MAG: flagellar M-ring protein FliF C-terminal domain-containing protein [Candidatus Sericytochromatia bacterium]
MMTRIGMGWLICGLCLCLLQLPVGAQSLAQAEQILQSKIERQLEAVLGPGRVRVSVTGELNTASQSRSHQRDNPQVAAERRQTQRHSDGSSAENNETQWTFDELEELRSIAATGFTRKSVSVVYEPPPASEDSEADAEPRVLYQATIEEMVRSAADIDESRGDRLSVRAARFDTRWQQQLQAELARAARQGPPWWVLALIGLGGLALGSGLTVWLLRRRKPPVADWQQAPLWTPPAELSGAGPVQALPPSAGEARLGPASETLS